MSSSVLSVAALVKTVKHLRRKKKRIAFTNGCFDLLHIGHLTYLEKVKAKADILIVAVNSDVSVRKLKKGPGRPLVPQKERARMVSALKPVDYVLLFNEATPERAIKMLKPDILAKGGDWKPSKIVGSKTVKAYGGKVISIPLVKNRSTTRLLKKLKN